MSMKSTLAEQIAQIVREAANKSSFSRMEMLRGNRVADAPIVGFADGYDHVIQLFKSVVSSNHRTPLEAWREVFTDAQAPTDLTVIAFVLPLSEAVRKSNHRQNEPSVEWLTAKVYAEAMLNDIQTGLIHFLKTRGYRSMAPSRVGTYRVDSYPTGPTANWSERHYAYAAGLGTFGLSRGLITQSGVAMRCASIVVDAGLPSTPRSPSHTAHCPFLESGGCGDCMKRCPCSAITPQGKDNNVCRAYLSSLDLRARKSIPADVLQYVLDRKLTTPSACGLCQTSVPCEASLPPRLLFK